MRAIKDIIAEKVIKSLMNKYRILPTHEMSRILPILRNMSDAKLETYLMILQWFPKLYNSASLAY